MFPIRVINLESSVERRLFMEKQLSDLGLAYEITPACNGSALTEENINSRHDKNTAIKFTHSYRVDSIKTYTHIHPLWNLSPAEIGCAISHRLVYREIVETNIDTLVVLEDDVFISSHLIDLLEQHNQFPEHWDLIFLGCKSKLTFFHGTRYLQGNTTNRYMLKHAVGSHHIIGSYAYIVNFNSAKKLLHITENLHKPLDSYLGDHQEFNIFVVKPEAVTHQYTFPSTIYKMKEKGDEKSHKEMVEYHLWMYYFPWINSFPKFLQIMEKLRPIRTTLKLIRSFKAHIHKTFLLIYYSSRKQ
ncbi:MAG: glycosyltransferase family 25 protein [Gammaproteobacteria bacterium]|nr:glycosyltransferase family 25 protein [Gammaproteobacteria bacterium]